MRHLKNFAPYFLTAIAAVAISWFYIASFGALGNWYSLPITALFTGALTLLIPWLGEKHLKIAYTGTSAGLSLFAILVVDHFVTGFWAFTCKVAVLAIFTVIADIVLSKEKVSFVDIAFDACLCFITSIALVYLPSIMMVAVLVLLNILVYCIQVKPSLFKKANTNE